MAENLQQVKKRIKTANSIAQITKAMEMIAASKIKKAQNAVEKNRAYADRVKFIVQKILAENNDAALNSSFISADVSEPAIDVNDVFSFMYKIHELKFSS